MKQILKYSILCLLAIFLSSDMGFAQGNDEDKEDKKEKTEEKDKKPRKSIKNRIVLGGNFGASFGTFTNINISPTVGYRITPNFIAGVGVTYIFVSDKRFQEPLRQSVYGGRAFLKHHIFRGVFAQVEYEHLFYKAKFAGANEPFSKGNAPAFLVGGGYSSNFNRGPQFSIEAYYDVLHTSSSLNAEPYRIRVGFGFGL